MRELLDQVRAWQAEGVELGRAVVVRTFGSAPRPEGASLVVTADGRLAGSVSGGCVEGAAAEEIRHARADGVSRVIRYGISDEQAREVGLACGGTIDVLVEPVLRPELVAAAADCGVDLWRAEPGLPPWPGLDDDARARVLGATLSRMHGNRSASCLTWLNDERVIRTVDGRPAVA